MNRINRLVLSGYQVFSERTEIPLGPITLLFGPNSAGKSAIGDAIQAISQICGHFGHSQRRPGFDTFEDRVAGTLERDWRRTGGEGGLLAKELHLGICASTDRASWAKSAIAGFQPTPTEFEATTDEHEFALEVLRPWLASGGELQLKLSMNFSHAAEGGQVAKAFAKGKVSEYETFAEASIEIDGHDVVRFSTHGEAAVNLHHSTLFGRYDEARLIRLANQFPDGCSWQDGWFSFQSGGALTPFGLDHHQLVDILSDGQAEGGLDADNWQTSLDVVCIFDAIWLCTTGTVKRLTEMHVVPASRAIPSKRELTYFLNDNGRGIDGGRLGLAISGLKDYEGLAASALLHVLASDLEQATAHQLRVSREQLNPVNEMLADHVFREKGYFVAPEVHALCRLPSADSKSDSVHGYLVTLMLEDAQGRRLSFDEVGSGLGYVLPVLVALSTRSRAFIQQPELHLHPALQAELADAFVSNRRGQFIVETHSEHLLLRILRRIRLGANGIDKAAGTGLHQDDVTVVYINPRLDGTSEAKELRVSREGDFLDRWPRGFFEERWKELFDE